MKVKSESEVAQLCPTLSDPMDCSLPGSSAHGIFQARVLEWGAIAFSKLLLATQKRKCVTKICECYVPKAFVTSANITAHSPWRKSITLSIVLVKQVKIFLTGDSLSAMSQQLFKICRHVKSEDWMKKKKKYITFLPQKSQ